MKCFKCENDLSKDEIGLYKKLVNRGADSCMCINCLSDYFEVSTEALNKKIQQYKELGCTLFY